MWTRSAGVTDKVSLMAEVQRDPCGRGSSPISTRRKREGSQKEQTGCLERDGPQGPQNHPEPQHCQEDRHIGKGPCRPKLSPGRPRSQMEVEDKLREMGGTYLHSLPKPSHRKKKKKKKKPPNHNLRITRTPKNNCELRAKERLYPLCVVFALGWEKRCRLRHRTPRNRDGRRWC